MATDPPPTVFFYPWFTIYFVKKSLRRPLSGTSLPLASFLFLLSRLFLLLSSSFVSISHFMASILQDLNVYQIIWKQLSLSKFMFYVFENVEVGSQLCFVKVDKSESQILVVRGDVSVCELICFQSSPSVSLQSSLPAPAGGLTADSCPLIGCWCSRDPELGCDWLPAQWHHAMFLSGSPLAALFTHPGTGRGTSPAPRHLAPRHLALLIARHLQSRQPLHNALKFSLDPSKADKTEGLNLNDHRGVLHYFMKSKSYVLKSLSISTLSELS